MTLKPACSSNNERQVDKTFIKWLVNTECLPVPVTLLRALNYELSLGDRVGSTGSVILHIEQMGVLQPREV